MPAWPDILSKYTILLSQSHNLTTTLVGPAAAAAATTSRANGHGGAVAPTNPYERLAVHPSVPVTEAQLDGEVMSVMRMQSTSDVAEHEYATIRHLAEHMTTRGSLGVVGIPSKGADDVVAPRPRFGAQEKKPEYSDVLRECEQIRVEHDERVERAVRAVMLLREKFDWKARVEVENAEPEEIEWMADEGGDEDVEMNVDGAGGTKDDKAEESNESEEEEELEEVLGNGEDRSQPNTPDPMTDDGPVPMSQG